MDTALRDFVPAISAIIGVVVGSIVSLYIARLNFRAQVKAKHLHEWVSVLRETIAEYQTMAPKIRPDPTKYVGPGQFEITKEDYEYSREKGERASTLYNKIKLMLDPNNSQHSELLKTMQSLNNESLRIEGTREAFMLEYQHKVTDLARGILSEENKRANDGK